MAEPAIFLAFAIGYLAGVLRRSWPSPGPSRGRRTPPSLPMFGEERGGQWPDRKGYSPPPVVHCEKPRPSPPPPRRRQLAEGAGVAGLQLQIRADTKVFRRGRYLMGFTSSFRMGQILRYSATLPEPHGDPEQFMATEFVDACREVFKAKGFATKKDDAESGGVFLVCFDGLIFYVGDDYQVGRSSTPFDAVGCGAEVAKGAMHALTRGSAYDARTVATAALEAAESFSAGVRGPFHFLESTL